MATVELNFPEPYNLDFTFGCGQIFRFQSFDEGKSFIGPLSDRIIQVRQQTPHSLIISSNKSKNLHEKVEKFFRVKDDYKKMEQAISTDPVMKNILQTTRGLHLLQQDPFECIISFILSQCSNIPRITHHLNQISEIYGEKIDFEKRSYFLFPSRDDLLQVSEETFRELKLGYRAKYIYNLIQDYPAFLNSNPQNSLEFNKKLKKIYGIGQKVADCIQLFAYGDLSWFPVDVWMRKFMLKHYIPEQRISNPKIAEFGRKKFGSWAGYAQEMIFHYARCYDTF